MWFRIPGQRDEGTEQKFMKSRAGSAPGIRWMAEREAHGAAARPAAASGAGADRIVSTRPAIRAPRAVQTAFPQLVTRTHCPMNPPLL